MRCFFDRGPATAARNAARRVARRRATRPVPGSGALALTLAVGLLASPARAETSAGLVAGASVARLYQTDSDAFAHADYRWRPGLVGGGFLEISGRGGPSLRFELSYVERGSRFIDPACACQRPPGYVPGDNDLRLSYVDLPVLVVWSGAGPRSRGYLMAGLTGSYLVRAEKRRNGELLPEPTWYFRRWDVGPTVGLGFTVAAGAIGVGAEARVGVGLIPVDENSSRNLGFQFLVRIGTRLHRS